MTLGRVPRQTDLLRSTVDYCQDRVATDSIYALLHRECFNLFPDEMFADLFTDVGRRSVPPMIVAVVMEIITATAATPGNSGDAEVADELLADILSSEAEAEAGDGAAVYGDAAYGAGELLARLDNAKVHNGVKVQPPSGVKGHFGKDRFSVDLGEQTVTCPAGITATIRPVNHQRHAGIAEFGAACATCPLASQCTSAKAGRTITIGHYEAHVAAGRARQTDPAWKADYQATRPKVERKIGHLMRRRHGGRRARVRGLPKVAADFTLLAAAVNLARLGVPGITRTAGQWSVAPA